MSDDLDRIHAALERQGYYLDPSLRADFSPEQITALEAGLAASEQPTYVVVYPLRDNDTFGGSGTDLITRLHDRYPEPGVYLSTSSQLAVADYSEIRLEGRQYDLPGERDGDLTDYLLLYAVGYENPPDLGTAFVRAVELHNAGPEAIDAAYEAARDHSRDNEVNTSMNGGSSGDEPGSDGGVSAPLGAIVAVNLAVLAVVVWWLLRRRAKIDGAQIDRVKTPAVKTARQLALPDSALERIREARDHRWEAEARDEVLRLGAAVDRVAIDTEAKRERWRTAQAHYVAARDVLEGAAEGHGILDVAGALVLARRGQSALDTLGGRSAQLRAWTAPVTCFLNPLHPTPDGAYPVGDVWSGDAEVPLCAACHDATTSGAGADVLGVEGRRGKLVPYFETDAEPWASTGYGALDDDLLGALSRARG